LARHISPRDGSHAQDFVWSAQRSTREAEETLRSMMLAIQGEIPGRLSIVSFDAFSTIRSVKGVRDFRTEVTLVVLPQVGSLDPRKPLAFENFVNVLPEVVAHRRPCFAPSPNEMVCASLTGCLEDESAVDSRDNK
ncbi:hypothetical protein KCU83_g42, partial [Aureobasidium melanogenum]